MMGKQSSPTARTLAVPSTRDKGESQNWAHQAFRRYITASWKLEAQANLPLPNGTTRVGGPSSEMKMGCNATGYGCEHT